MCCIWRSNRLFLCIVRGDEKWWNLTSSTFAVEGSPCGQESSCWSKCSKNLWWMRKYNIVSLIKSNFYDYLIDFFISIIFRRHCHKRSPPVTTRIRGAYLVKHWMFLSIPVGLGVKVTVWLQPLSTSIIGKEILPMQKWWMYLWNYKQKSMHWKEIKRY